MDITTEAVRLGLDMAQLRLQMASFNIAHADTDGMVQRADFSQALGALDALAEGSVPSLVSHGQLAAEVTTLAPTGAPPSLDDMVAQASIQGGVYRALTEGMSRRFGLMQLAISGK